MSFPVRMKPLAAAAAWMTAAAVAAVFLFLVVSTWPLLASGHIFGIWTGSWQPFGDDPSYGVGPMIVVSVGLALGAVALAYPLALGLAVFMHGMSGPRPTRVVRSLVQFMAGVPTVVYGFVAVMVLVPLMRDLSAETTGFGLLPAILTLAVLILPTMVLVMDARLGSQDRDWTITCRALGMTHGQTLDQVLLPQARSGLVAAGLLGLSRALGDTLVALMVAGNAARFPGSLLDSVRALTAHIALVLATDAFSPEYRSVAAAGLALFLLTGAMTLVVRRVLLREAAA